LSDNREIVGSFTVRKTFFLYNFTESFQLHTYNTTTEGSLADIYRLENGKDYAENLPTSHVPESNRETENLEA